jgi:peptide/nickel transport system substrate-binding protein
MWWLKAHHFRAMAVVILITAMLTVIGISQQTVKDPTILKIDTISQPESLDPAWSFLTADSAIEVQMYEHLIDYKGGSTSEYLPELASALPTLDNGGISKDGLTYVFTLKPGITFWDGTSLSCADVEYSFERIMAMDREGGPSLLLLDPLIGISATRDDQGNLIKSVKIGGKDKPLSQAIADSVECNANQVTFHLAHVFPPFLQVIAHSNVGNILSKAFAIKNGAADNKDPEDFLKKTNFPREAAQTSFFDKAMGTGPFKLQKWDRAAQQVILARNENYRDGPAKFENVIYSNVPEFNTRLLKLSRGDTDVSYLSSRTHTQQLKDAKPVGVRLVENLPGLTVETVHLNQDVKVATSTQFVGSAKCDGKGIPADFFRDIHVRKAFSYAFDQPTFIKDVLLGAGKVAPTPIAPSIGFFNPNQIGYEFDLNRTESELKAARCTGSDKSVWDTGFKFTIVFNEGNTRRQQAALMLEQNIEKLNAKRQGLAPFDITVLGEPSPVVLTQVNQQEILPIFIFGWSPDYMDIDNYIRQWMHSNGNYSRHTGINVMPQSAQWDKLIDEAITTVDPKRRQEIYFQLQKDFVDNALAVMMPYRTIDNVERSWIDGNYYNPAVGDPQQPPDVYKLSKKTDAKPNTDELKPYNPAITEFK